MGNQPSLDVNHDRDARAAIAAAATGDAAALRQLLARNPLIVKGGRDIAPALPFAVRGGHIEAVRVLLAAGADPRATGFWGDTLAETAADRGLTDIARLLDDAAARSARVTPSDTHADHPIHLAAEAGDLEGVRALLDADPTLVRRADRSGGTPLHRAVMGRARSVVTLLLDRGADIHAIHGAGLGSRNGYAPENLQPIDMAPDEQVPLAAGHNGCVDAATARVGRVGILGDAPHHLIVFVHPHEIVRIEASHRMECGAILLDAGAEISAREHEYQSTPLASAARNNLPDMVEFLLARGAPANLPDDEAWATPLAWATRRRHAPIVEMLRKAGAAA